MAIDGAHEAWLCQDEVKLKMSDVGIINKMDHDFELHTGSPHYVMIDENHSAAHVDQVGKSIRYNDTYKATGINVNLLKYTDNGIQVATYERGVEAETLSCGTGCNCCGIGLCTTATNQTRPSSCSNQRRQFSRSMASTPRWFFFRNLPYWPRPICF